MEILSTTLSALTKAGWFEGRKIDISSAVDLLKEKGYQITPAFIEFYSEFGNLLFPHLKVGNSERGFEFKVESSFFIERDISIIERYPKALGCETLTLVGYIAGPAATAISEAGMLYSLHDGYVIELGIGIDAINKMVNQPWPEFKNIFISDWHDYKKLRQSLQK